MPGRAHLLLPVQDADDGEDEHAHADERHGRQQDDVAGRQVQFGTPAAGEDRQSDDSFNVKIQFHGHRNAHWLSHERIRSSRPFAIPHSLTGALTQDAVPVTRVRIFLATERGRGAMRRRDDSSAL